MKVAIVHDWLTVYAGAERALEQILLLYPQADLFCVCDFLPEKDRHFLHGKTPKTTFIQKLPLAHKYYRHYLPLMPLAIEQHDLSGYDLVISSSHAVAKGVITGPDQVHVCYAYTPIRYAWDLQHTYLKESGLTKGLKSIAARLILHYIRLWDLRTVNGVNQFIAISGFIKRRIQKIYARDSAVVYPPVDIAGFKLCTEKDDYYVTASRMVPYKKIDLIVEAFAKMPHKKLVVIGDGPEMRKIAALAQVPNVQLLGYQPYEVLLKHLQKAKAFIFAAEEDFGIAPLEAQACGTPVIAYGRGGACETINGLASSHPTGVFFSQQTAEDIIQAVEQFEKNQNSFTPAACRKNAERFSVENFKSQFTTIVDSVLKNRSV